MEHSSLKNFFAQLTSPTTLTELLLITASVLISLALGHMARSWYRRKGFDLRGGWQPRVVEGSVILTNSFAALVLILLSRGLVVLMDLKPSLTEIALQIAAALLVVRLCTFLLRLVLGPQSWFVRWELRIVALLWFLLSFTLLGWFDLIERTLDSIDLIPGKNTFSLWALLKSIVVVTGFIIASSLVSRAIERRVMKLEGLAMSTRIGISKFTYFLLLTVGVMIGVNSTGIDLTALTVLTGAVGLGLGFGLQSIVSNFVSGFVLLMDKSIKPGDVISFTGVTGTSTENFGWVQELRGRYVVVRDRDGVETLVPNQNLITNSVINWSYSDRKVRLKLPVRISYQDDPELALSVLVEAANCNPRVLQEPLPVSRLMHFSDHGIDLELRFWIADPENGVNNVRSDVNRAIWKLFQRHQIKIPVAQREIRIIERDGRSDDRTA